MIGRYPESLAIKDGLETPLSYRQMGQRLNSIAYELQSQSVQRGDRVAVFQNPGADLVCSLLAIMRIGAVYIPLDLRNATARLTAIVEASKPKIILSHRQTAKRVHELNYAGARNIDISSIQSRSEKVPNISIGDDPAFILFTSGSTGVPKGIVLKHSNLARKIESFVRQYKIGREIVLQQSAFSFDLSLAEIFTGLAVGGTLIVVPAEKRGDSVAIAKLIRDEKVTYTEATPSEYSSWIQFGGSDLSASLPWKFAFIGGEELKPRHLSEFKSLNHPSVRLYNCWGPTEVTISATKIEIDFRSPLPEDFRIPIGHALPGYAAHVVDEKLELVAVGIPGEIVISGPGVSVGYLDDEQLTTEKFLPDKFGDEYRKGKGWTTMFRTGDRGYLREDGAVVFQGRMSGDTQIKLRGIRIDLLDIEATIVRASEGVIADVVVSVRTEAQFLVAHVVFAKDSRPHDPNKYLENLISELHLPSYMRPAFALVLDIMPLTIHSKIDRRAVANLQLPQRAESPISSKLTPTESRLKHVWEDVLTEDVINLFDIGPDTDFFSVGGNSLLLVVLQSLIRQSFNVALPLLTLLDASSLGRVASKIEQATVIKQIDWIQETEVALKHLPPKARLSHSGATSSQEKTTKGVILLTGATGYLGSRILSCLVKDPTVREIHCVAVRKDATGRVRKLPITSSKIFVHNGDLTTLRLGLSETEADSLAQSADAIIHCGAKRSFWDNYEQLRDTNVGSTKQLVEIAMLRKIPIHFISSGGVLQLDDGPNRTEEPGRVRSQPPIDGSNGYVASKWAGETYLQSAAAVLGIPVSIYRFTPSPSVIRTHPSVLEELVKFSRMANSLPDPAGWAGNFDLVKAEGIIQRICKSVLGEATGVTYVHLESEIKMDATATVEHLYTNLGNELKDKLPALEWVGKIKRLGFEYIWASQNISVGRDEGERLSVVR
jgi:hybrid polyketide synthase/nonribosomal peptide synthetase ACE1